MLIKLFYLVPDHFLKKLPKNIGYDFSYVSLAHKDSIQVNAHKVILSDSRSFFTNVTNDNDTELILISI